MAIRKEQAREALPGEVQAVAQALSELDLRSVTPPPPEAFASVQPFCVDTMTFPEWIQFVFLPKIEGMLEAGESMPPWCDVAPMAEEYFRNLEQDGEVLIEALRRLDERVTAAR
ncbi:MAG: YqcC family protein [Pseudomonadota bacterium]